RCCIELVGHYRVTNGSRSSHIVVGHAHEITGVAFVEKFGDGTGSEYTYVVGVRLNGNQDLAGMRLSLGGPFNDEFLRGEKVGGLRAGRPRGRDPARSPLPSR